jgi:hypothetical protein
LEVPIKLKNSPEPRYNCDDYYYDLKEKLQESHAITREKLIKRKIKSKERYDVTENPIDIHVEDQILLKDFARRGKLTPLWIGPYLVTEVLNKENIKIQRGRRFVVIHKNNVKKFYETH